MFPFYFISFFLVKPSGADRIRCRNWKTFNDQTFDFCQGITLHHLPGHTDGLIGLQINMPGSGTFLFISDHCHVMENVGCV